MTLTEILLDLFIAAALIGTVMTHLYVPESHRELQAIRKRLERAFPDPPPPPMYEMCEICGRRTTFPHIHLCERPIVMCPDCFYDDIQNSDSHETQ